MSPIRIHKRLDSHVINLPELKPLVGKTVDIVITEANGAQPGAPLPGPKAGSARGQVTISPDFDAPLPDFDEYSE